MCDDFIDLNKAYCKDCDPLQKIDRLINATVGNSMLSFMDIFYWYH